MRPDVPIDDGTVQRFQSTGYVVFSDLFDPIALTAEVDRALDEGVRNQDSFNKGPGNRFQYVPMMTSRTPRSLSLIQALAEPARRLLEADPLPTRAKGTRYSGSTAWHRDSESTVSSIGFLAYLEPLTADTGALRVVPGSHRTPYPPAPLDAKVGTPVVTEPGDLIAFDEHLLHSTCGGDLRRQWRIDFVGDPLSSDADAVRSYFAGIYQPGWDGGYDVDLYPSYDHAWQSAPAPWTARLAELGVFDRAATQEDAVRHGR